MSVLRSQSTEGPDVEAIRSRLQNRKSLHELRQSRGRQGPPTGPASYPVVAMAVTPYWRRHPTRSFVAVAICLTASLAGTAGLIGLFAQPDQPSLAASTQRLLDLPALRDDPSTSEGTGTSEGAGAFSIDAAEAPLETRRVARLADVGARADGAGLTAAPRSEGPSTPTGARIARADADPVTRPVAEQKNRALSAEPSADPATMAAEGEEAAPAARLIDPAAAALALRLPVPPEADIVEAPAIELADGKAGDALPADADVRSSEPKGAASLASTDVAQAAGSSPTPALTVPVPTAMAKSDSAARSAALSEDIDTVLTTGSVTRVARPGAGESPASLIALPEIPASADDVMALETDAASPLAEANGSADSAESDGTPQPEAITSVAPDAAGGEAATLETAAGASADGATRVGAGAPSVTESAEDGFAKEGRANGNVYMRSKPDNAATALVVLNKGDAVDILVCDGWCEVVHDGRRGFVYGKYIDPAPAVASGLEG